MARSPKKPAAGGAAEPSGERPPDGEAALPPILPLTNDIVFKGAFGAPECQRSLAAFLQALCPWLPGEEFESIALPDTRRKRRHIEDKECVLDLTVTLKSGQTVAVEMQMYSSPFLANRAQYYGARMVSETLAKGGEYWEVPRVVTIFILGERLFRGSPSYRHEYRMLEVGSGAELPNSPVSMFFELAGLPAESDGTAAWLWLRLFGAGTREELEAFVREEPAMSELAVKVLEMSADKRARLLAISREKWRRDHSAILRAAETAHGRGREEGRAEVVRRMLAKGLSTTDITGLTGLTAAEVERLRRE